MAHPDRPAPYPGDHEDLKPGDPPRPATEPEGSEGADPPSETLADPFTGEPLDKPPGPPAG